MQLRLVELIALSLIGKQSHWNAYGREFLRAHRHLVHAERPATVGYRTVATDASCAVHLVTG